MIRLSALVCVSNQDSTLADCLRRLSFCDEIVVVADRCTDRSQEIARRAGAVVIDGIFPLESQRKSAGLELCSGDWILEIEPDEFVDPALAWEVRAALQMRPAGDHFEIPVDNYVGSTLVRHGWAGGLGVASSVRLYRRGVKHWKPQRLHGGVTLAGAPAGALKGALRRTVGRDIGEMIDRLNRLTALNAEDLADACDPGKLGSGVLGGARQFLRSYLARKGWQEGRLGFLVALMAGLYPVLSHLRAREVLESRRNAMFAEPRRGQVREVVGFGAR